MAIKLPVDKMCPYCHKVVGSHKDLEAHKLEVHGHVPRPEPEMPVIDMTEGVKPENKESAS